MSKEFIDVQNLVIQEYTKEEPSYLRKINVFLKGKLTNQKMTEFTKPGNKVKITGVLRETPIIVDDGISTMFDFTIEAKSLRKFSN